MRKAAIVAVVLGACVLGVPPAGAGDAGIPEGTIKGKVIDRTCYGPCYMPPEQRLFTGEATVEAYHLPDRELYGSTEVQKGRFTLLLPPGKYRLTVTPNPKSGDTYPCWQGSSRRVEAIAGELTRKRLWVENICVV